MKETFEKTIEAVVTPTFIDQTKEINTRQRQSIKRGAAQKFFERTSTLGTIAFQLPIFLVKEFSLARINAFLNILFFGGAGVWAALKLKVHYGNLFMMIMPILILALSVFKIINSIMTLSMVYHDTQKIKLDVKNDFKKIPMFIVKVYRTLVIKQVDINWLAILFYIAGGLFILLPTVLHGYTIPYTYITFKFADFGNPYGVYSIVKYALVVVLFFQIFYLVWVKNRMNVINQFYGYEIVPNTEVIEIRKVRHAYWRRATTIVLLFVFFIFIIAYKLLRREKILR